ncbi:hypothetical protein HGB41_21075 [Massilia sp. ML15P13]|uniref:Integrase catalytic domain-containing protein n=1 Tax=Telluria aromaticivorans TaxID=2725995 RepID=A0A7Y2K3M1_9BURK|nr:hypothetical protein [Telluria aromaticivorans]
MRKAASRGVMRGKVVRSAVVNAKATFHSTGSTACSNAQRRNYCVSDFTYLSIWRGFAYVAFVIDIVPR